MASLNVRAALLSVSFLILALGLWEMATQPPEAQTGLTEYEMLMGGVEQESRVPPPSAVIRLSCPIPSMTPAPTTRVLAFSLPIRCTGC